jgi:hypothetical protein
MEAVGMQGSGSLWWNCWSLVDPHPGQYFIDRLRLWLITVVGQPVRRPSTYSPICTDGLPSSYTVPQPEWHIRTRCWRAVMETTSWWQPTSLNLKQRLRWVYKNCSSHWADGPPGHYWVTWGLHPEEGSPYYCQWSEGLGSEETFYYGWC